MAAIWPQDRGAQRVATAARSLLVHLRRAAPEDADQLWRWANDDAVRAASFHPEPIPWDDHVAWFQRLLASESAADAAEAEESKSSLMPHSHYEIAEEIGRAHV